MAFRYTMVVPLALIFVFLCLHEMADAKKHLKLTAFGPKRIKGRYQYNEMLGIKFDIRPRSMEMKTLRGELLASYMQIDNYTDYFQITDQGFVSGDRTPIRAVPKETPQTRSALSRFANQKPSPKDINPEKAHEAALGKLQHFEEVQFLEAVSEALADAVGSGLKLQSTQAFHLMCLNLVTALKEAGKPVPQLIDEALRKKSEASHTRTKRCTSLKNDPYNNNCYGMCGLGCSCWWWVCGDCCYHQGCYEHDYCCREHGLLNKYCRRFKKYKLECDSYGGYKYC